MGCQAIQASRQIDPGTIDLAVSGLKNDPDAALSTLSLPLRHIDEMMSDAVVKLERIDDAMSEAQRSQPTVRS